jgi:hypothetical protein
MKSFLLFFPIRTGRSNRLRCIKESQSEKSCESPVCNLTLRNCTNKFECLEETQYISGNCINIDQLNSGDIVCGNKYRILIWSLSSKEIRLYLSTSINAFGVADNLLVLPDDDLVAAFRYILYI